MTDVPHVSVVMPTHNRRDLLAIALMSVLRQHAVALEVIVVDDGSSIDVRETVDAMDDDRVVVARHATPQGVVAARNTGIRKARGRWIGFCDDDDVWAPDKLVRQMEVARSTLRRWVYSGSVDIDLDHGVLGGAAPVPPDDVAERLRKANVIPGGGSGVLVTADLIEEVGGFDPRMQGTAIEDWELWLRLSQAAPPAWVCAPLIGYRVHPGNAHLNTRALAAGMRALAARDAIESHLPAAERHLAFAALRRGQRRDALRHFGRAALAGEQLVLLREVAGAMRADMRHRLGRTRALTAWQREAEQWLNELVRDTPYRQTDS